MADSHFHIFTNRLNRAIHPIALPIIKIEFLADPESRRRISIVLQVNPDDSKVSRGYIEIPGAEIGCIEDGYLEEAAGSIRAQIQLLVPDIFTGQEVPVLILVAPKLTYRAINAGELRWNSLSTGQNQVHAAATASLAASASLARSNQQMTVSTIGKAQESTAVSVQKSDGTASVLVARLHGAIHMMAAVIDSKGGENAQAGLDTPSVRRFKGETRHLRAVYCSDTTDNAVKHNNIIVEGLPKLDANLHASATLDIQIVAGNVEHPEADLVLEVGREPTTLKATSALATRGTTAMTVIPAIVGLVTVQCFEENQVLARQYRVLEQKVGRMGEKMKDDSRTNRGISEQQEVSIRTAA